jgi:hypothetical protein
MPGWESYVRRVTLGGSTKQHVLRNEKGKYPDRPKIKIFKIPFMFLLSIKTVTDPKNEMKNYFTFHITLLTANWRKLIKYSSETKTSCPKTTECIK